VQIANTGLLHECPECRTQIRAELFNAFHRPVEYGRIGQQIHSPGQAECFYHPGKMAGSPCSNCGRLLCALCEIPIDGRILCTNCLQTGQDKHNIQSLGQNRVLYDSLALHLAFWPLILFPLFIFTLFTAPAVIYIVVRYWHKNSSILPRSKFRFVLAFLLAVAQMVSWVAVVVAMLG
jgi:hypothetical protein